MRERGTGPDIQGFKSSSETHYWCVNHEEWETQCGRGVTQGLQSPTSPTGCGLKDQPVGYHPREPVWTSGKALGWKAEGPWLDSASALLSLPKGCGLWTLSCDFVPHN